MAETETAGNISVVCRFRPQNTRELNENGRVCIRVSGGNSVEVSVRNNFFMIFFLSFLAWISPHPNLSNFPYFFFFVLIHM